MGQVNHADNLLSRLVRLGQDVDRLAKLWASLRANLAVTDLTGTTVVAADPAGGLAVPWVQYRPIPSGEVTSPSQSTTSATFTALHRIHGAKQHPKIKAHLICVSDPSTTGEVQLRITGGAVIAGPLVIPAGDSSYRDLEGALAGAWLSDISVDVEARRTAGTGVVRVGTAYITGKGS